MNRVLVLAAGAVLALTSQATAAPDAQPLTIAKECSEYTGETPSFCTITESNLAAIPVGTKIFYYGPEVSNPRFGSSVAVLSVGAGDSAVGYCVTYDSATPMQGTCAFHAGSGSLSGFQAVVKVTVDDKQIYHWDGDYVIGPSQ
jgi:hypothetical protein